MTANYLFSVSIVVIAGLDDCSSRKVGPKLANVGEGH